VKHVWVRLPRAEAERFAAYETTGAFHMQDHRTVAEAISKALGRRSTSISDLQRRKP
jgi:hypothetical protein